MLGGRPAVVRYAGLTSPEARNHCRHRRAVRIAAQRRPPIAFRFEKLANHITKMDENPYQSPDEANVDANLTCQGPSLCRMMGHGVIRFFVGLFGGFFVALMICFAVLAGTHGAKTAARMLDFAFLPMIFAAAFGVGWAAYSAVAAIRVAAWAAAGLGLGLIIARVTGIPHRMVLLLPVVLGLAFSILGYQMARRATEGRWNE